MNPTIEIFHAGRHTAHSGAVVEITSADLAESAAAYDPVASEAPVVVGHPTTNGPAYGWVKTLHAANGRMEAELGQVDPEFMEMVRAGRYKKISAAFYSPSSPDNPAPGKWYLRHIGFLGAQPPAIKGLRPVVFAGSGEGVATIDMDKSPPPSSSPIQGEDNGLPGMPGADNPHPLTGGAQGKGEPKITEKQITTKETIVTEEELRKAKEEQDRKAAELKLAQEKLAAEKAKFAEAQAKARKDADAQAHAELAEKEKALAARERELAMREHSAFVKTLVAEGKVLPVAEPFLANFMAALPGDGVVEFAEADGKAVSRPLLDGFKSWLTGLPKIVEFGERAPGSGAAPGHNDDEHIALGKAIADAAR